MATFYIILSAVYMVALVQSIPHQLLSNKFDEPSSAIRAQSSTDGYRLPGESVPLSYNITLTPHISEDTDFEFHGQSVIIIDVKRVTKTLTLHAKNLEIDKSITLKNLDHPAADVRFTSDFKFDKSNDFLTITFDKNISLAKYELNVIFRGKLNNETRGFYRSSYSNQFGKKQLVYEYMNKQWRFKNFSIQ